MSLAENNNSSMNTSASLKCSRPSSDTPQNVNKKKSKKKGRCICPICLETIIESTTYVRLNLGMTQFSVRNIVVLGCTESVQGYFGKVLGSIYHIHSNFQGTEFSRISLLGLRPQTFSPQKFL